MCPATKAATSTESTTDTRSVFRAPAATAKAIAPRLANHATAKTAVGPSVQSSTNTSSTQPRAAPTRSAAYSWLIRAGNRVSTRLTTMPLTMHGTATTA